MAQQRFDFTLGIKADISQAEQKMNELANSLKKIASNPPSLLDDQDLKDATKSAQELEKHLSKAVNVNTGKLDLSKFSKSLSSAGQDLTYFQKNLSKLGVEGEQAFLKLAENIAMAEVPTVRLNNHLKNFLDELIKVGRWQLSSNIMHGLQGAIQTAYGYAQDLNESLTNIRIVTGQTTDEMAKFALRANDAAKALSTTTTNYTDAALIFYQQGLAEDQVEERTNATIKMANATGENVTKISDQLTAVWNNFDNGTKPLEYYADVMTALGAATASSTDEIAEGIEKFASISEMIGLSYEYAASALTTVTDVTRQSADVVGTAFKTIFARIQGLNLGDTLEDGTTLNKYSKALASVGISIFDQNQQLKDMDDILDEMGAKWSLLSRDQQAALAQTVAGVRQYNQLVSLMDNWDFFKQNVNVAKGSEGTLTEQSAIYEESWEASLKRVRASAEGIYDSLIDEEFFIKINDIFAKLLEGINGAIDGIGGFEGILKTLGSVFMSYFASKMPKALSGISNTFSIITGKALRDTQKIQQESINSLSKMRPDATNAEKIQQEGLKKVAILKRELTNISNKLTEEEKEENQNRIQQTADIYANAAAIEKEAAELRKFNEEKIKSSSNKITNEAFGFRETIAEDQNQINTLSQIQNRTKLDDSRLDKATSRVNELTEQFFELKDAMDEVIKSEQIVFDKKDWEEFSNMGELLDFDSKESKEYFQYVGKGIDQLKAKYIDLRKQEQQYEYLKDKIDINKAAWTAPDFNLSLDEAKNSISQYLRQINELKNQGFVQLNIDTTELQSKLQSTDVTVEDLQKSFISFLSNLSNKASKASTSFSNDGDKIHSTLLKILTPLIGDKSKAEKAIEGLRTELAELTKEEMDSALRTTGMLSERMDELPKHTYKASEAIMELGSALMSLNSFMNSVNSTTQILEDNTASMADKIGAVVGVASNGIFTFNQTKQAMIAVVGAVGKFAGAATTAAKSGAALSGILSKGLAAIGGPTTLIISAIVAAIMGLVGFLGAQSAKAEKELEEINKRVEELKQKNSHDEEVLNNNKDLIKSYETLLDSYKKTGEGKEELDNLAYQLAEAYNIEGASLAKLTGLYSDYEEILNKTQKEQIANTKNYYKQLKNTENEYYNQLKGKGINNLSKNNKGKYVLDFYSEDIWYQDDTEMFNFANYLEKRGLNANINTVKESFYNTTLGLEDRIIYKLQPEFNNLAEVEEYYKVANEYIELNQDVKSRYIEFLHYTTDAMSSSENNEDLDALTKQIQQYELYLEQINNNNLDNIKTYPDYDKWLNDITKSITSMGYHGKEAKDILESIINLSTNKKLNDFYEISEIVNDLSTRGLGAGISKSFIGDLLNAANEGKNSYDKLTLASLNWSVLTKDNWEEAANAVQNYTNAVKDATNAKELRDSARNALSLLEDGLTEKEGEELKGLIDWGNEEKGIIEYTEFLKMSLEEQKSYLEDFANVNLFEKWTDEINSATEAIKNQEEVAKKAKEKAQNDLTTLFNSYTKTDALNRGAWEKITQAYSGLENWFSLETFFDLTPEKLDQYLNDNEFLASIGVDEIEFLKQLENTINEAEENIELELNTNLSKNSAEYLSNQLKKLIDEYDNYIEIGIDLNSQEAEDKLNEILAKKYKLDVYISNLIADNELNELKELNEAVGLIGDNWIVNKENLEQLEKAFPGILSSYKVLSDGTIQLQEDQAKQFIKTSNIDIETKQKSLRAEATINENKAKQYNEAADKYENYLSYTNLLDEDAVKAKQEAEGKKVQIINTTNSLSVEDAHKTQTDLKKNDNEIYEAYLKVAQGLSTTSSVTYQNMAKDSEAYAKATMLHMQKISLITSEKNTEVRAEKINQYLTELNIDFSEFSDWNTTYRNYKLDDYYNYDPDGDSKKKELTPEERAEIRKKEQQRLEAEYAKVLQAWDSKEREDVQKEIAALRAQANNYSNLAANDYATAISLESYKMSYDSSVQNIGKNSSSSTSNYQEIDKEYNPYQNVNNTIEAINLKLEEQKAHTEQLQEGTEEHLASLENERSLIAEIGKYQQEKLNIAENELATLEQKLSQFGAEYDPLTKKIVNYDEIVNAKAREVDRLNKELAAAPDSEKERLQEQVNTAEKLYNNVKELADEHSNTVDIINDTTTALRENGQAIEDNIKTQEEFNKELQKAREEIEKTNKEIQETIDNLKDEVDIYHQLNHELDKQNEELDRLSKLKDSLYGENHIKAAKQELEVVKQTQKTYEDLLDTTLDDLENAMGKATVHFDTKIVYDEDGAILNYQELQEELVRKAETAADNLTAANIHSLTLPEEQREEYLKPYQDAYDNALAAQKDGQDAINKVHDLRDQAYNYGQQARDSFYKGLDLQAELWDYKFNLQIEINDNDLEELEKQLEKIEDKGYEMSEAIALINIDFRSLYENNYTYLQSEIDNLQSMYSAGEITEEAYIERLKKIQEEAKEAANELEELDEKVYEYYGITLEKANEELEFYIKQMEHATEVLDHYKNIIELVNGEYDYERLGIVLEGQAHNLQNEMEVAVKWFETLDAEKAAIEAELANPGISDEQREKLKEAYEPIYEAWMEAHDEMLSKTTEWVEATKAVMENTMAKAARDLEMSFTDGVGFDALNDSMDRLNEYSDIYLTKTNQIYEVQKMMRTAQQAADKTDNASSKQRLKAFMDELGDLQEKNKLSNLELEIAQKKYDLLEAQIALEEAQNAKSTVRLQRDSEGNFGYVYTANQEQVAEAETQVYEAEQELYNLALESANDYAQKRIELQQSLYDDLVELEENRVAGMYATEEEYNKAREQLIKEYNDLFIAYEDQYNLAIEADSYLRVQIAERYNKQQLSDTVGFLDESTQNILETTTLQQETWITHFDNILEKTRGWRNDTNSEYDQSAIDASEWLTATQGYLKTCEDSYKTWQTTVTEQNKYVQDALANTQEKTDKLTTESDELKAALIGEDGNGGLVKALGDELQKVRELITEYALQSNGLDILAGKYESLRGQIDSLISSINSIPDCAEWCVKTYGDGGMGGGDIGGNFPVDPDPVFSSDDDNRFGCGAHTATTIDNTDNTQTTSESKGQNDKKLGRTAMFNLVNEIAVKGEYGVNPQRKQMVESLYPGAFNDAQTMVNEAVSNKTAYETGIGWDDVVNDILDKNGYNTGGYTGAWGPEGRLALLHEKEIVLNKEDTKNFLHATDILRSISDVIDLQAMSNQFNTLSASIYSGSSGMLEQSVHIEANFPNVSDRNEIEEAFNNLINTASQYANRKTI